MSLVFISTGSRTCVYCTNFSSRKRIRVGIEKQKGWTVLDIFVCFSRSPLHAFPLVSISLGVSFIDYINEFLSHGIFGKHQKKKRQNEKTEIRIHIPLTPAKSIKYHSSLLGAPSYNHCYIFWVLVTAPSSCL